VSAPVSLCSPRIARIVAVTLLWIARTLSSLLVACPLVFAITATGLVNGPDRDAVLFRPGGLVLLELVRNGTSSLGAALKVSLLLGVCTAALGLIALGASLDLLRGQEPDPINARLLRGAELFPRFLGLSVSTLLGQAASLLAASLLAGASSSALHGRDERLLTVAPVLTFGLGLLCCAWLGAVQDVARSAVVQRDVGARAALFEAFTILRNDAPSVLFGSYPSVAGSAFAWLCAAWLVMKLELSGPSTRGIVLAFLVHQAAVLFSLALRVRWLSAAIALSARADGASARD
jgi:hypothetical protein